MARTVPTTDKRLLGTWRSDRRATLAEWRFKKPIPADRLRRFRAIFGKLVVTYSAKQIRGVFGDFRYIQRYQVLGKDSESVAIRYEDKQLLNEWRIQHIHFEGKDRHWIGLGWNREWFRRIKKRAD